MADVSFDYDEEGNIYDDRLQRHREVMSFLYERFWQDGKGRWKIYLRDIYFIFEIKNDYMQIIMKLTQDPSHEYHDLEVDIETLENMIRVVDIDENDKKSFYYYRHLHYQNSEIFEVTTPRDRQDFLTDSI